MGGARRWAKLCVMAESPKVGANARLFGDYDLDAVPVSVIDGKNLW
jgi:hypothetical protein